MLNVRNPVRLKRSLPGVPRPSCRDCARKKKLRSCVQYAQRSVDPAVSEVGPALRAGLFPNETLTSRRPTRKVGPTFRQTCWALRSHSLTRQPGRVSRAHRGSRSAQRTLLTRRSPPTCWAITDRRLPLRVERSPGSPGGRPPRPPQTRTSAINASGSSKRRIRSRRLIATGGLRRLVGQKLPKVSPLGTPSLVIPFATHSLPPIGYPVFERYYETTATAASVRPPASVSLAGGCFHGFPCFARPQPRKSRFRRQDVGKPGSSKSGNVIRARCGSLSFPGYPHMPLPCSRTPVSPHAPGLRFTRERLTMCMDDGFRPPYLKRRDHDVEGYFGIQ